MILTAWEQGVGSNWTGFGGLEDVRRHVGLDQSYEVLAVLPFGYPARRVGLGQRSAAGRRGDLCRTRRNPFGLDRRRKQNP